MSNGIILWEGASMLDGAPIVAIAIGLQTGSTNSKTGAMLQTYILRADVHPLDAIASGEDASICGDCPHRGTVSDGKNTGRTCYVQVGQGPAAVYKAYKAGKYPRASAADLYEVGKRRIVRLGTYGDPAAIPSDVWARLICFAVAHTGYTHQWRKNQDLRGILMASADSLEEGIEAQAAGWRTFRVAMRAEAKQSSEAVCPASAEAGKKLTCAECLLCHGSGQGLRKSIVIQPHGGFAVMANVSKYKQQQVAA
jgi:hypothetical protein